MIWILRTSGQIATGLMWTPTPLHHILYCILSEDPLIIYHLIIYHNNRLGFWYKLSRWQFWLKGIPFAFKNNHLRNESPTLKNRRGKNWMETYIEERSYQRRQSWIQSGPPSPPYQSVAQQLEMASLFSLIFDPQHQLSSLQSTYQVFLRKGLTGMALAFVANVSLLFVEVHFLKWVHRGCW